ncbi:hypothetical protein AOZ06_13175 [Kibdelosporangium phytohabitans]|uniref:Uncharacterized protein n=1 Tax=Kibdelosporangium phytohabitans TaxID=860235 RepID=A0A0N7F354_9PSEU|nr:hypothetical protein AOZ06_12855 [Kibdelosporangium phytohabitans]ALG07735.1 hypothetical protein AOZ06_13175 [Kibdelosporangium phytohabitans]
MVCPHPSFGAELLDRPGVLFVLTPSAICAACLYELVDALNAASAAAQRRAAAGKEAAVAAMTESLREVHDELEVADAIGVMMSEGGAVWAHES